MKRLLSGLAMLLALSAATPATRHRPAHARTTYTAGVVYVCMSKGSIAYHSSSDCGGLNRCTHEVKSMSAALATQIGKRACKKCY